MGLGEEDGWVRGRSGSAGGGGGVGQGEEGWVKRSTRGGTGGAGGVGQGWEGWVTGEQGLRWTTQRK